MLLFPIFQRTFKAVLFNPRFYRSAKVCDHILVTKFNFKKLKKDFDFFNPRLVTFCFKNYPFFIWECEGNGECYIIQILFKIIRSF